MRIPHAFVVETVRAEPTSLTARVPRVITDVDCIADRIADCGWAVVPGFLSRPDTRALALDCRRSWEEGEFRRARVGIGATLELRPEVRTDRVRWLREPEVTSAERRYLDRIEQLRMAVNRRNQLGLFEFECHYAVYPPGAYYRRHLDRFRGAQHRVISCILYLNEAWDASAAGCLRLFFEPDAASSAASAAGEAVEHRDVPPEGGTLVVFLSGLFEHEVLPATRERMSLTGWLRTRR